MSFIWTWNWFRSCLIRKDEGAFRIPLNRLQRSGTIRRRD